MAFPGEEFPAREVRRPRRGATVFGPNRIRKPLGPQVMQTFQISAPLSTHFRRVTCAEVGCLSYQYGWRTIVDLSTELGGRQAEYIKTAGRRFTSYIDGNLVNFVFEAGQEGFDQHWQRLPDIPELYLLRQGDWRGNPEGRPPVKYTTPEEWVADFTRHLQKLRESVYQIGEPNGQGIGPRLDNAQR